MSLDSVIAMAYVYSVTATLCDLTLGLLPIALVWNLQMNTRTKSALAGILGMGCVYVLILWCPCSRLTFPLVPAPQSSFVSPTCTTTKTKISSVSLPSRNRPPQSGKRQQQEATEILTPRPPQDATTNISIWSNVEASLGIIAGSLVTLRPLFRWFRDPSSAGTRSRSKRNNGSVPLSSVNVVRSDPSGPQYWRPDWDPEDSRAVITTIHTSHEESRTSSQEDLNPKQGTFFKGVNVQKTFYVSGEDS